MRATLKATPILLYRPMTSEADGGGMAVEAESSHPYSFLLLGERWAYEPHKVISNRRVENGYSAFIHDSKPEIENLANKSFANYFSSRI